MKSSWKILILILLIILIGGALWIFLFRDTNSYLTQEEIDQYFITKEPELKRQGSEVASNCQDSDDFNILEKGVNVDNANLIIREDFSMPMNLDPKARYDPILFMNAPKGNLDKPLDQQSNESIDLSAEELSLCRNCKLAVCKDDYCSLQNNLFM